MEMADLNKKIMLGAGPFYYEGNNIGVLMIHGGGGGTCADLKPLAEALNQKEGWTVRVPLLPGFGTTPKDLRFTPISAWKNALDKELSDLKQRCTKVIVGGHSMGAVFSLILSTKYDVDGIFSISAAMGIKGIPVKLAPFFSIFIKYFPVESERWKRETHGKWIGYDYIPTNIAKKMKFLIKEAKGILSDVKCPIILFQGRLDSAVKKWSMDYIYDNISSRVKMKVWLENNDHPILESPDHAQIESELKDFIKERLK